VLIVMPLMPVVLYVGFKVYVWHVQRQPTGWGDANDSGMELQVGVNILLTAPNSIQEEPEVSERYGSTVDRPTSVGKRVVPPVGVVYMEEGVKTTNTEHETEQDNIVAAWVVRTSVQGTGEGSSGGSGGDGGVHCVEGDSAAVDERAAAEEVGVVRGAAPGSEVADVRTLVGRVGGVGLGEEAV
jgi:hypothetical protein